MALRLPDTQSGEVKSITKKIKCKGVYQELSATCFFEPRQQEAKKGKVKECMSLEIKRITHEACARETEVGKPSSTWQTPKQEKFEIS